MHIKLWYNTKTKEVCDQDLNTITKLFKLGTEDTDMFITGKIIRVENFPKKVSVIYRVISIENVKDEFKLIVV
jgi:hypothetical protein